MDELVDVPLEKYKDFTAAHRSVLKGQRVALDFPESNVPLPLDPYFFGLWLGDGTSKRTAITTLDIEIINYLIEFAKAIKETIRISRKKDSLACTYFLLLQILRDLKVYNNKRIPENYLKASREERLELLAGLIDSDGNREGNALRFTNVNQTLLLDVAKLCRTLGFYVSIGQYKLYISGNVQDVPCKVRRKKVHEENGAKDLSKITVASIGKGKYYGFAVDGDNRYLLEDFTITHNSGKTAFVDTAYLLNPYQQGLSNRDITWLYFSMERNTNYKILKFAAHKMYTDHNILIDVEALMGYKSKLKKEIYDLAKAAIASVEKMLDKVHVIEGPQNPTGIYKTVMDFAQKNGKFEKIQTKKGDFTVEKTVYTPNKRDQIVIIIQDHLGNLNGETRDGKYFESESRGLLQIMSSYNRLFRDMLSYHPVAILQMNRNLESSYRSNGGELVPGISDFKNASNPYEDADEALILLNPFKLKARTHLGMDLATYVDQDGNNRFRALHVLKNSFGPDDVAYPLYFLGENGFIKPIELKTKK